MANVQFFELKEKIDAKQKKIKKKFKKNKTKIVFGFLAFMLVIISVLVLRTAKIRAISEAEGAFSDSYEAQKGETYQYYYDMAYSHNEKKYHVSNKASISIGNIREESRLEVLSVSDVVVITHKDENSQKLFSNNKTIEAYCALIPGKGVYTVNLRGAEFIVDEESEVVIVRVPAPVLNESDVELDEAGFDFIPLGEKEGTYGQGQELGVSLTSEGQKKIYEKLAANQDYFLAAKENSTNLIIKMIKSINSKNYPNLKVYVEYV